MNDAVESQMAIINTTASMNEQDCSTVEGMLCTRACLQHEAHLFSPSLSLSPYMYIYIYTYVCVYFYIYIYMQILDM